MKTTPLESDSSTPAERSSADLAAVAWASCLGAGYFPVASGTFGTLVALPFAFLLSLLPSKVLWALVVALYTAVTVWAAHRAGKRFGVADARQIVADEWAGFFVAMLFVPWTWKTAAAGFFLFRLFDVLKPWPANYFDRRLRNGFGVTFDDVAAGVWTRLALEVLLRTGLLGT
ncbi:MAG: phosphatidylglycerophosphatase A [Pseudomonadota bacterium]|nr:MAG: phosphatidylglycerophosphatase A [Pseudomonadota bacterium]